MDNIEFFNRTTAALFKQLLATFPQPIMKFHTEQFRAQNGLPHINPDKGSEDVGAVIEWLAHEGFIRFKSTAGFGGAYLGLVLTSKGLSAMNVAPDSLQPTVTVGARLKELSAEASKETISSLVRVAIDYARTLGT